MPRGKCLDLTPIVPPPGYAYVVPCLLDLPASTVDMVMPDKLFRTSSTKVIAKCQRYFAFFLPTELVERNRYKFVNNYYLLLIHSKHGGVDLIGLKSNP